jgi:hypothetical protein
MASLTIGVEGMHDELDTGDFKESDTGFKVVGGFRCLPFVKIEAGYMDFGSPTDSTGSGDASQDIEVSLNGGDVAGVPGVWPLAFDP